MADTEVDYSDFTMTQGINGEENGAYLLPVDNANSEFIDVSQGNGYGESITEIDESVTADPAANVDDNPVAAPGFGDFGNVTPSLPAQNPPASPGFGDFGDVTPSLPAENPPASPGFGNMGNVTPSLPSNGGVIGNITVIPIIPNFAGLAFVRFFNGNATGETVDIYVNGRLVVKNLVFKAFSNYFSAISGIYRITVYKSYNMERLLTSTIRVRANYIYTACVAGRSGRQQITLVSSLRRVANANLSYLRFINLAQNAPNLDIYIDGILVISDLIYQEVSNYVSLLPGEHTVTAQASSSSNIVSTAETVFLEKNTFYGGYVVGNVNTRPTIQIVAQKER